VLAFVLLTGYFPFKGSTDQELYSKINTADYPCQELGLYKEAHNLISKMFVINPENRISANEVFIFLLRFYHILG
jgi:MAP/microtubule affinity-regulating kinase